MLCHFNLLISLPLRFARNLWGQFRLISCLIFNESMRIDKLIMIGIIPPHSFLSVSTVKSSIWWHALCMDLCR